MPIYTDPPEWPAEGQAPPEAKRNAGWQPRDRVPASWLNWFWNRTAESLREIAQAFVNHRDASAPHDGHETKTGATQKVQAHSDSTTGVHGVGAGYYVAKTTRPDQLIGWDDVQDKPTEFPAPPHNHDDRYYTKSQSDSRYAPIHHSHGAADLPKASTSQEGIVRLTNDRTNRSETLALTARAMDDHRGSGDHDIRYYTKSQIDQLLVPVMTWYAPSDTPLVSASDERKPEPLVNISFDIWAPVLVFSVPYPGRYRVTGEYRGINATLYDPAANPYDVGLRAGVRLSVASGVPVSTSIMSQRGRFAWGDSEWVPFELDMEIPTRTGLVIIEGLYSYDTYASYPDAEPGGVYYESKYGATWVRNIVLRGTQTSPDSEQPFEVIRFI